MRRVAVFAASGALKAGEKEMDIFGFVLLACVTGIGGGTLRDLLLAVQPVFGRAGVLGRADGRRHRCVWRSAA